MQIRKGEENPWVLDKPDAAIIMIGYPFIRCVSERDQDDKLIRRTYHLADHGYPVKELFYSKEHHSFACVRTDVYDI